MRKYCLGVFHLTRFKELPVYFFNEDTTGGLATHTHAPLQQQQQHKWQELYLSLLLIA